MDAFKFIRIKTYTPDAFKSFDGSDVVVSEQFVMFWKSPSPFDQWTLSPFTIDGIRYVCPEQYMMASKARLFGDYEMEQQILATDNPKDHKQLGRAVRGFDHARWEAERHEIVFIANVAKYSQNSELKELLLDTGNKAFVEASPADRVWGIGLAANHRAAYDRATWMGLNLLGNILNEVRSALASSNH